MLRPNKRHLILWAAFLMVATLVLSPTLGCRRPTAATPTPQPTPTLTLTPTPGPEVSPTPTPETREVKVYFPRNDDNNIVFVELTRTIPKTEAVGTAALNELLKGPTEDEKARGLYTPIPEGTKLLSLEQEDGAFYADFDAKMLEGMGGSARVMAVIRIIELTLKQFPTVKEAHILVEGQEDALQP